MEGTSCCLLFSSESWKIQVFSYLNKQQCIFLTFSNAEIPGKQEVEQQHESFCFEADLNWKHIVNVRFVELPDLAVEQKPKSEDLWLWATSQRSSNFGQSGSPYTSVISN